MLFISLEKCAQHVKCSNMRDRHLKKKKINSMVIYGRVNFDGIPTVWSFHANTHIFYIIFLLVFWKYHSWHRMGVWSIKRLTQLNVNQIIRYSIRINISMTIYSCAFVIGLFNNMVCLVCLSLFFVFLFLHIFSISS